MTDDFDKLLAECPPTEADRAWARAVLASPAALLQDQIRDLSRWLSDRPGPKRQARVTAAAMAAAGFTARDRRRPATSAGRGTPRRWRRCTSARPPDPIPHRWGSTELYLNDRGLSRNEWKRVEVAGQPVTP